MPASTVTARKKETKTQATVAASPPKARVGAKKTEAETQARAKASAPPKHAAPKAKESTDRAKAKSSQPNHELTVSKIVAIREKQRLEGNFDCFGRASSGFCDQSDCSYYVDCLFISGSMPDLQATQY